MEEEQNSRRLQPNLLKPPELKSKQTYNQEDFNGYTLSNKEPCIKLCCKKSNINIKFILQIVPYDNNFANYKHIKNVYISVFYPN